jgi:hypothetical protein
MGDIKLNYLKVDGEWFDKKIGNTRWKDAIIEWKSWIHLEGDRARNEAWCSTPIRIGMSDLCGQF